MRRPLSIALLAVTALPCFGAPVEQIAEDAIPSVVRIVTYDITGSRRGQGSGFFISPRKIITNGRTIAAWHGRAVRYSKGFGAGDSS
jgi:S1-C subfamily serine protease